MLTLQSLPDEAAKPLGKRAVVNEEAIVIGADELVLFGMPCQCGNDAVDVRVVLELSTPCVQHAGEAGDAALGFGGNDVAQGGG